MQIVVFLVRQSNNNNNNNNNNNRFSALDGSRNIEDLKGLREPVCTATPTSGVHEVCILQLLSFRRRAR